MVVATAVMVVVMKVVVVGWLACFVMTLMAGVHTPWTTRR